MKDRLITDRLITAAFAIGVIFGAATAQEADVRAMMTTADCQTVDVLELYGEFEQAGIDLPLTWYHTLVDAQDTACGMQTYYELETLECDAVWADTHEMLDRAACSDAEDYDPCICDAPMTWWWAGRLFTINSQGIRVPCDTTILVRPRMVGGTIPTIQSNDRRVTDSGQDCTLVVFHRDDGTVICECDCDSVCGQVAAP